MNEAQTMAALTGLVTEIHYIAVEHGWWECEACKGRGGIDCAWTDFTHDCPTCGGGGEHRNIGELLALAHSELSEALEAKRAPERDAICDKCEGSGGVSYKTENGADVYPDCAKCGNSGKALGGSRFAEELADVLIRVLDICGGMDVDIASAVVAKMKYNEGRPRKHGKAF